MAINTTTFKLSQAIAFRRVDEIKQLLAEPGLVNQLNENHTYPLMDAVSRRVPGSVEIVKLLLEAGAAVNGLSPKKPGQSPLRIAAYNGNAEAVKLLIAAGADVNVKDDKNRTPLIAAVGNAKKSNLEIVRALIAGGADVNAVGPFATVLMDASRGGSPHMLRALIAAGARVDTTARCGTALIMAAQHNRDQNVAVLLENGADARFRLPADFENADLAGKTALDLARQSNARRVVPLLLAALGEAVAKKQEKVSVADAWKKIEAWLTENNPEIGESLNEPAEDGQIADLEKIVGVSLPADFRESWKIHNGNADQTFIGADGNAVDTEEDGGYYLMNCAEIVQEWQNWKGLVDGGEFASDEGAPDVGVRDDWWHAGWIPFASNGGGDSLCLDLAPTDEGRVGQVITMDHETGRHVLLAPSFTEWFAGLAESMEFENT